MMTMMMMTWTLTPSWPAASILRLPHINSLQGVLEKVLEYTLHPYCERELIPLKLVLKSSKLSATLTPLIKISRHVISPGLIPPSSLLFCCFSPQCH